MKENKKRKPKIENKFSAEDYKKDLKMNLKAMCLEADPSTGELAKPLNILSCIVIMSFSAFIVIMIVFACRVADGKDEMLNIGLFLIYSVAYAFALGFVKECIASKVDTDNKNKIYKMIDDAKDLRDILDVIKYMRNTSFAYDNKEYKKLMKEESFVELITYEKLDDEIHNIQGYFLCTGKTKRMSYKPFHDGNMKIIADIETDKHVVIKKEIEVNTQMRTDIEEDVLVFENYKKPLYQYEYGNNIKYDYD